MLTQIPNPIMILVNGSESFEFLQNIVTNDLNKLDEKQHNFILTPQGRIKYEIFIYKGDNEDYLVECSNNQNNILEYFKKYAELSDVSLNTTELLDNSINNENYLINSISNGIIDTNFQETGKFFPSEISNNAIDYEKGCYVGQEVVSRMKHRQLNKNFIRVFEKIEFNEKLTKQTIDNFEIIDKYKDYLIIKFKVTAKEIYLKFNDNLYKLINKSI